MPHEGANAKTSRIRRSDDMTGGPMGSGPWGRVHRGAVTIALCVAVGWGLGASDLAPPSDGSLESGLSSTSSARAQSVGPADQGPSAPAGTPSTGYDGADRSRASSRKAASVSQAGAAGAPPMSTDSFVGVVASIRPSVVAIGTYHPHDRPTIRYAGTGFVVHDGNTVATNAHVVAALRKDQRLSDLRIFFADSDARRGRGASVLAEDPLHDVALLRFSGPRAMAVELHPEVVPPQGRSVGILGYPIGTRLGLTPAVHRGVVSAVVPAVLPLPRGVVMTPQLAAAARKPYQLLQLDLVVFPGNSGSPLFEADSGRVVAIINKTLATGTREHMLEKPSGIAYAVPIHWVDQLIRRTSRSRPAP